MDGIRTALVALSMIVAVSATNANESSADHLVKSPIGTVQIDKTTIGLLIAYRPDSAILQLSIREGEGLIRYLPLLVSTHRGLPVIDIDLYASEDDQVVWVLSSLPDQPVLAHYRLGADTGQTSFGKASLSETAFPEFLSGGPLPYPVFDPQKLSIRTTFYLRSPR